MEITRFYDSFGLASVFPVVLLEQLGAPIPAMPFLVLAGARATDDPLHVYAGRRYGERARQVEWLLGWLSELGEFILIGLAEAGLVYLACRLRERSHWTWRL